MSRNFEIAENPRHADGASLRAYSLQAYNLALAALQPEGTEPLTVTPPPGFLLTKRVEARDTIHYVVPGKVVIGMQTGWSEGELLRSRSLWTPGIKALDIDGHPNLLLDVPLVNLPRELTKPPRNSWMGLEVDESALVRGLVRLMPIGRGVAKPFDTPRYIGHLLGQNR